MPYAKNTSVAPEKSKAEIEGLLRKYGADQFVSGWESGRAMIGFRCKGRFIRFELAMPSPDDDRFYRLPKNGRGAWCTRNGKWGMWRTEGQAAAIHEQEVRRLWRALALVIKAKLEAVQSGITTFEHEFMAQIVLPDGKTVAEHVVPAIADAYSTGKMPRLLPMPASERPQ